VVCDCPLLDFNVKKGLYKYPLIIPSRYLCYNKINLVSTSIIKSVHYNFIFVPNSYEDKVKRLRMISKQYGRSQICSQGCWVDYTNESNYLDKQAKRRIRRRRRQRDAFI